MDVGSPIKLSASKIVRRYSSAWCEILKPGVTHALHVMEHVREGVDHPEVCNEDVTYPR